MATDKVAYDTNRSSSLILAFLGNQSRGVCSIFGRRGCAVFQGIVFTNFSRTGYQSKDFFLEQVVQRHIFSRAGYHFTNTQFDFCGFANWSQFVQLSHGLCSNFLRPVRTVRTHSALLCIAALELDILCRFFLGQGITFRGKFWSRLKFFVMGTPPYKKSSTPPPLRGINSKRHHSLTFLAEL